ncbi:MAG: L-lactate permease [Clostridiales bacterium]|nr:L-lactate permease [Clostridiales bacterium]
MNIPMTPLFGVAAAGSVAFLLIAIMKFGWGVAKAAPVGMLLSGLVAIFLYRSEPAAIALEAGKGVWNAATILLVIWPAIFSYEMICESGGFQAICRGIQALTRHELVQILILGWIFPSFLQGITGFGVAVAVGAPLLLSIGVKPFYSIVIVVLCHCWGATFGTLALAWEALIAQTGINSQQTVTAAVLAASMIWIYNLICVCFCLWLYGKQRAWKESASLVLFLSLILGGGELLLAPSHATIACFLPSALGLVAIFGVCRTERWRRPWRIEDSRIMDRKEQKETDSQSMSFHQAFLPYYALTGITIFCLLIPPVNRLLSQWKLGFSFPETVTASGFVTAAESLFSPLKPLTYAGSFLALSAVLSGLYYRKKGLICKGMIASVWKKTVQKCMSPTIAITCFIIMSKFMSSSGQIYVLSQGVVSLLGRYYVIAAPFFGMLGAFITSSNMSANILLGNFQRTAADFLGVNPALTAALQTVGGILGNAFAPGCVMMGISTTGYAQGEGTILKTILPISLICAIVFGVFGFLLL